MSYDAARAAGVGGPLLDLFEIASVLQDEAWYVEHLGVTRAELRGREARALEAVFPHLEEYLERMGVAPYIVAPIVSDEKWRDFVGTLQTFGETSNGGGGDIGAPCLHGDDSSMRLQVVPNRSVRLRSML
jgi:hypothetical protein